VHLLEDFGALDRVEGFVSKFGRAFYGREIGGERAELRVVVRKVEGGRRIEDKWVMGEENVVPFWAGKELQWEII